jgi:hypothetical protein
MESVDQEKYLSNIIKISRLDGILHSKEEELIEMIRNEIGATKTIFNQATRNAEISEELISFKRFSDNVRNFEDMLSVALSDGSLSENEKKAIAVFAKRINLTQEQISIIVQETKQRVSTVAETTKCFKCKQEIPINSKFCPSCGLDLINHSDGIKETKLDFQIPTWGITIEFCESTSATFSDAIKTAKLNPTFQECVRSKKNWYCVTYQNDKMLDLLKLVDNLKGMRNRKVYIKGESIQWDEVFGFLWCFQQRQQAYKPEEYCFGLDEKRLNIWGCKQAQMDWTDWSEWLTYGKFTDKNNFNFDKKRIFHELKTNLYQIRYCPHFMGKYIEAIMSTFPNDAKVTEGGPWAYKENYQQTPGAMKIVRKSDFFTQEIYVDGVKPVGFDFAKALIKDAINKCGIKQLDYSLLEE